MLDSEEYQDGKAHAGITASGKWLVKKHLPLLKELRKTSNTQNTSKTQILLYTLLYNVMKFSNMSKLVQIQYVTN